LVTTLRHTNRYHVSHCRRYLRFRVTSPCESLSRKIRQFEIDNATNRPNGVLYSPYGPTGSPVVFGPAYLRKRLRYRTTVRKRNRRRPFSRAQLSFWQRLDFRLFSLYSFSTRRLTVYSRVEQNVGDIFGEPYKWRITFLSFATFDRPGSGSGRGPTIHCTRFRVIDRLFSSGVVTQRPRARVRPIPKHKYVQQHDRSVL